MRFSPELVDEKMKASVEPLHAQMSALTEMMDRLIQSNSAKEATTASSRGIWHQYESPYSEAPGSSRFPTVAPLTTAGYSPDKQWSRHDSIICPKSIRIRLSLPYNPRQLESPILLMMKFSCSWLPSIPANNFPPLFSYFAFDVP